ncbi:MAG: nucleoside kinase, partial [Anaerovoracaceae bacterium]
MKINLKKAMQEDYVQVDVAEGTTLEALYRSLREEIPYPVLAGKVNYKMKSLTYPLTEPCNVELLDVRTPAVNLIYQNSLCVLYLKAIRDLMKTAKVHIQNSLNKGLYTEVRMPGPITDQQVGKVEARMRELVEADLPFGEAILNREES